MPDANPAASMLREPAQSKCTWTCHKKHFVQKLTGKMLNASGTTSIEHRALTVTVRTLSGHTVWGKNRRSLFQVWFIRFFLGRQVDSTNSCRDSGVCHLLSYLLGAVELIGTMVITLINWHIPGKKNVATWDVLKWGSPKITHSKKGLPWNKPTSYWGTTPSTDSSLPDNLSHSSAPVKPLGWAAWAV